MMLSATLPVMWNFGESPSDGLGGQPVNDGGLIHVWDVDDDSSSFEQVLLKVSISELIDDVIDASVNLDGVVVDDGIDTLHAVRAALFRAIQKIDGAL